MGGGGVEEEGEWGLDGSHCTPKKNLGYLLHVVS